MLKPFFVVLLLVVSHATIDCNYQNYLAKFQKTYSAEEQARREPYFQATCADLNNPPAGSTCTLGLTKFTDWTPEELEALLPPLLTVPAGYAKVGFINPAEYLKMAAVIPPSSLDYKAKRMVTPIKDQQNCGSCWAFAATAMYESSLLFHGLGSYNLSYEFLLYCQTNFAGRKSNCQGGYIVDSALTIAKYGTLQASKYPYKAGNFGYLDSTPITPGICYDKMRVYVGDTTAVSSSETPTKFYLQQALTLYGPMMVGIYASTSFTLYTSGVYNLCPATTTPSKLNHAVLLYGYDSDGNWLIKNYWGTYWGNQGYMVLSSVNDCGISLIAIGLSVTSVNKNVIKSTWERNAQALIVILILGLLLI